MQPTDDELGESDACFGPKNMHIAHQNIRDAQAQSIVPKLSIGSSLACGCVGTLSESARRRNCHLETPTSSQNRKKEEEEGRRKKEEEAGSTTRKARAPEALPPARRPRSMSGARRAAAAPTAPAAAHAAGRGRRAGTARGRRAWAAVGAVPRGDAAEQKPRGLHACCVLFHAGD